MQSLVKNRISSVTQIILKTEAIKSVEKKQKQSLIWLVRLAKMCDEAGATAANSGQKEHSIRVSQLESHGDCNGGISWMHSTWMPASCKWTALKLDCLDWPSGTACAKAISRYLGWIGTGNVQRAERGECRIVSWPSLKTMSESLDLESKAGHKSMDAKAWTQKPGQQFVSSSL